MAKRDIAMRYSAKALHVLWGITSEMETLRSCGWHGDMSCRAGTWVADILLDTKCLSTFVHQDLEKIRKGKVSMDVLVVISTY